MDSKIKFLDRAAQTYALTAPSLSAYIMLERAATAEKLGIESRKDRKDVCRACGTLLISGITSRVSLNRDRRSKTFNKVSKRKDRSKSAQSEKSLETHCLACHRFSKVAILPSKRQNFRKRDRLRTDDNAQSSAGNGIEKASAVNVSNKRTKSRRKGGLQALVQRTKESQQTSTSFGLDLMDFMKEG